jgi:hypothetical protein
VDGVTPIGAAEGLVDPRPRPATRRTPAPRLTTIDGARVGFLHNHKPNAARLFEMIGELLRDRFGAQSFHLVPTNSLTMPAPREVVEPAVKASDVVVVGTGDSGSPSLLTVHDALQVEQFGVPAVPVCTNAFVAGASMVAAMRGAPDLRFAVIEHPLTTADEEGLRQRAVDALAQIVAIATGQAVDRAVDEKEA